MISRREKRFSGSYVRILLSRSVKLVDSFTEIRKGAISFLIAAWTGHWVEGHSMREMPAVIANGNHFQ